MDRFSIEKQSYFKHLICILQLYDIQDAPEYKIHKLEISRRSETVCREIIHIQVSFKKAFCQLPIILNFPLKFQCTSWPDRSAPDDPNSLLQLLEVTKAMHDEHKDKKEEVSLLVHCSAGVGRTGNQQISGHRVGLSQIFLLSQEHSSLLTNC